MVSKMKTAALRSIFSLSIGLLLSSVGVATEFDPRSVAAEIDDLILAHLKAEELEPNPTISDGQFLRRTYLAIIGRVPTIEESDRFLASTDPEKHSVLIRQLLADDVAYSAHHFQFWADLLRVQGKVHWSLEYMVWIRDQIAANVGVDDGSPLYTWRYEQRVEKGERYGVDVEITTR